MVPLWIGKLMWLNCDGKIENKTGNTGDFRKIFLFLDLSKNHCSLHYFQLIATDTYSFPRRPIIRKMEFKSNFLDHERTFKSTQAKENSLKEFDPILTRKITFIGRVGRISWPKAERNKKMSWVINFDLTASVKITLFAIPILWTTLYCSWRVRVSASSSSSSSSLCMENDTK